MYKFIFNFLDVNRDQQVTIIDLIFFYTYIPTNCQFGEEIAKSITKFANKFVINHGLRPRVLNIEWFKFIFPQLPCLVTELMVKIFGKEPTNDMTKINTVNGIKSVFAIDESKENIKNEKLFYHIFDEKFECNAYHLQ
jgi:hypothetical protein